MTETEGLPEPDDHQHFWTLGNVSHKLVSMKQGYRLNFLWMCKCGDSMKAESKFHVSVPREGVKS